MTDNQTTERLMAMLEERGVEYKTHGIIGGKAVTWHGSVCNWVALPDENGLAVAVYKDYLTPDQAIAATLGSEFNPDGLPVGLTISDDSNLLNWRGENYVKQSTLGSGTLTAEQVRDAINELQKKQPYCYDPDKPLDTLKTIGRYIGELESTVLRMYREHPIAQFEQWIEDLGLNEVDAWKPRTLEEVLYEFGIVAARELNADPDGYGISDKTIAKCASEIRELLDGDEGGVVKR